MKSVDNRQIARINITTILGSCSVTCSLSIHRAQLSTSQPLTESAGGSLMETCITTSTSLIKEATKIMRTKSMKELDTFMGKGRPYTETEFAIRAVREIRKLEKRIEQLETAQLEKENINCGRI